MVGRFLHAVHEVARQCDAEDLFGTPEITLSAGGSAVFDLVARDLPLCRCRARCARSCGAGATSRTIRSSTSASCAKCSREAEPPGRSAADSSRRWKSGREVQSRPEPGLAILAFGKRDASFDIDLPMPFARVRAGVRTPLDAAWRIDQLNDQHAYLAIPADADIAVGDLVGCGISHPCTTFDKWRWMPVVDDDYGVTGAIRTYF